MAVWGGGCFMKRGSRLLPSSTAQIYFALGVSRRLPHVGEGAASGQLSSAKPWVGANELGSSLVAAVTCSVIFKQVPQCLWASWEKERLTQPVRGACRTPEKDEGPHRETVPFFVRGRKPRDCKASSLPRERQVALCPGDPAGLLGCLPRQLLLSAPTT